MSTATYLSEMPGREAAPPPDIPHSFRQALAAVQPDSPESLLRLRDGVREYVAQLRAHGLAQLEASAALRRAVLRARDTIASLHFGTAVPGWDLQRILDLVSGWCADLYALPPD